MASKTRNKKTEVEPESESQPNVNSVVEVPQTFPPIPITKCINPTESHKEVLSYYKILNNYYYESFATEKNMNEYVDKLLTFEASKSYLPTELQN